MALRDFFLSQSVNEMFPSRLPGTAKGWDESSVNREVILDPEVPLTTEVLPSMAVKLTGRPGQALWVEPCTAVADEVFGFIIYKAKNYSNHVRRNQIATVARHMQLMDFVFKTGISAGDPVYQDPTDHYCTADSNGGVYVGMAMETIPVTAIFPTIATVEIQLAANSGSEGGGTGEVISVNGKKGNVILTGADINATLNDALASTDAAVTKTVTEHLQTLNNYTMTLQAEVDTNAGKTAELDADVQGKVDKDQGAENAGQFLKVDDDGNVGLGEALVNNTAAAAAIAVGVGADAGVTSSAYGYNAKATSTNSVSIGSVSFTNAPNATAVGSGAKVTGARDSIQLGQGNNTTVGTCQIWNYNILNKDTGLMPAERLASGGTTGQVLSKTADGMAWVPQTGGGVVEVAHDDTLSGKGTTEEPLSVVKPVIILREW